jgi:hypothetical protein
VGQRYAARCGSSCSTIVAWVNATVGSGIASSICRGWLVKQGRSASPRRNYKRGRCCRRTDALFPPKIAPNVIKALIRGRHRGALFRARQRPRPFLQRSRARQMVAGFARVPGAVGRPAELRRFAGAVSPRSDEGPIRRAIDANLATTRQRRQ